MQGHIREPSLGQGALSPPQKQPHDRCLRNINHRLAASQVNVRGSKEPRPSSHIPAWMLRPSLTGTHTGAYPTGSPNRHPEWAGPEEPWLGGPPLLAASAPCDLAEVTSLSSCLNLPPGRGWCTDPTPVAAGHFRLPAAVTHTRPASSTLAWLQPWAESPARW